MHQRLSSNGISSLGEGQFAGLSQLTDLYLDGNFLTALPPAVFSSLPALLSLNLASNQIAESMLACVVVGCFSHWLRSSPH
jgi:Leucine-rich repeat (LRR) protein